MVLTVVSVWGVPAQVSAESGRDNLSKKIIGTVEKRLDKIGDKILKVDSKGKNNENVSNDNRTVSSASVVMPQESLSINQNNKVHLTGAVIESLTASTTFTVSIFGLRFNINVLPGSLIVPAGLGGALADFQVGDRLSIDGTINRSSGVISTDKINNHSLQQRKIGDKGTSVLERRINDLLAMIEKLREEIRQRQGGGSDTTAPVLSSLATTQTTSSVTVNWTTNELSRSKIYYSTSSPVNLATAATTTDNSLVLNHSLVVSGLTANTTYFFVVESVDAAGNVGRANQSSFVTSVAPDLTAPILSAITATGIASTTASISWNTNELATSKVYFSTISPLNLSLASSSTDSSLVASHSRALSGLTASTTYFYVVESQDAASNVATSSQASFVTLP